MANVQHSSLTGAELHEPKGADSASTGEVYVSDGAGSGAWGLAETLGATKDVTGTDGYVKLPGGVILQWAYTSAASGATVTFPLAFPSACFFVAPIHQGTNGTVNMVINTITHTDFTVYNNIGTVNFRYFAIGY